MVIVLIGDALAGMSVVFAAASLLVVRRRTGVGFEAGT
jgi:crotonobetainyl-CoA:carnitine CoA-transferase CaiB-like acyl-CoA transferase